MLTAVVLAVGASSLSTAAPVLAQEGRPEWPQFQGGPGHPGALSDGPTPPYRVTWRMQAPEGSALSGAVILGDLAYTVSERAVHALDLATGEEAWSVDRAGGPLSVPAVVAGGRREPDTLLYLEGPGEEEPQASPPGTESPQPEPSPTSEDQPAAGSELVALDLAEPTETWRVPLGATSRTGVTVAADVAYVGDDAGSVHAVSIADGRVLWTAETGAVVDAPIAVADGRVIAVARDEDQRTVAVYAFAESGGERLWRRSPSIGSSAASVASAADERVLLGLADRMVRALGGEGEELWSALTLSVFSPIGSPALLSEAAYLTDIAGGVYRLDPRDGERAWSYQLNEVVLRSSPVVSGTSVLVGLNDGRLVAIDTETGHLVWESEATPGLIGTIALTPEVIVAVKGGVDAGLIAFEHDPDGTLVDEPSPTELDVGTTLARVGIAGAVVLAVVLVPGRLARRRFGWASGGDRDRDEAEAR